MKGLESFCTLIGEDLHPHEGRIAWAYFGPAREIAAILPRGNAKTTLAAKIAAHHLLSVQGAAVTIGAASVAQARIAFERMRGFAQHEALQDTLVIRHLELRHEAGGGLLRVVPSEGPRVHGLSSTLYMGDEVWACPDAGLLEAMVTGLVKRPDSKVLVISTPAANLDTPLGRMRARALAQPQTVREGPVVEAAGDPHWPPGRRGPGRHEGRQGVQPGPVDHGRRPQAPKGRAVPDLAFAQFHACRWGLTQGSWLPAGAWQACIGKPQFDDGEPIWVGVDVGGEQSASAVVWVNADPHVGCAIYHGSGGVLECVDQVRDLADRNTLQEVVYDPWRFGQAAEELERERVPVIQFPQTDVRMVPASLRLHAAIVEGRLTLPDDAALAGHSAPAIAKHSRRGWRLDKANRSDNIDGIIALCMALERPEHRDEPVELLGWLYEGCISCKPFCSSSGFITGMSVSLTFIVLNRGSAMAGICDGS